MEIKEAIKTLRGKIIANSKSDRLFICYVTPVLPNYVYELNFLDENGNDKFGIITSKNMIVSLAMGKEVLGFKVKNLGGLNFNGKVFKIRSLSV